MTFLLGTLQAHHSQENGGSRQVVVGRVSMPTQRRDKQNKEMITVKLKTTEDPLQGYHKEQILNTEGIKHRESTKDIEIKKQHMSTYFIDHSSCVLKFLHVFNSWKPIS